MESPSWINYLLPRSTRQFCFSILKEQNDGTQETSTISLYPCLCLPLQLGGLKKPGNKVDATVKYLSILDAHSSQFVAERADRDLISFFLSFFIFWNTEIVLELPFVMKVALVYWESTKTFQLFAFAFASANVVHVAWKEWKCSRGDQLVQYLLTACELVWDLKDSIIYASGIVLCAALTNGSES